MAIHNGYENINRIKKLDDPWEGKTGIEVEDFISRRLSNPLGKNITYENETLTIYNPEGNPIASGQISVVTPNYYTTISLQYLNINNLQYNDIISINYTDDLTVYAAINVRTYYEISGKQYNLSNKVDLIFSFENTIDQLIVKNITPNTTDDSLQLIDITPLFKKNLQNVKLKVFVSANTASDETYYAKEISIHKIELNCDATYVTNHEVPFTIKGLSNNLRMRFECFILPLGDSPNNQIKHTIDFTDNNSTQNSFTLRLNEISGFSVNDKGGVYQIIARIIDLSNTIYSNYTQANIIDYDPDNKTDMMGIISNIPTEIINCDNANLYTISYVPGIGGNIEIIAYLEDIPGDLNDLEKLTPFNTTSITTTSNDEANVLKYYSYVELKSIGNSTKSLAFKLKINGKYYDIYQLGVNKGSLTYKKYFTINIVENPYNVNNVFNYTEGAIENFSQIVGQSTTFFTDINSNIETSDGWISDENLIAYKISGQNKNLFTNPKDFSSLLNSNQGFTIEVMLKNYNINGEDPVMNIGNLLFGPGFTRINNNDLSDEGIYVNSRADFEKEVMTHLMFVYDPNYKPKTYLDIYDQLFNENGLKYSDQIRTYPIFKVYVNGCINREIEISRDLLKNNGEFKLQICPKSSDLNLYIFRTYNRALSYSEIQKNYISSRSTSREKEIFYDRNDILSENGKISFYKSMLKNNVIVFVLPKNEKPLFFGNRLTNGEGESQATILIRYKDENYKHASGRLTSGKYKSQGSSAKKYMFHNPQYSKGIFLSEDQIKNGITDGTNTYTIPSDPDEIGAKKLVGKVNYASSMQSHKIGATKLYDRAYKEIFSEKISKKETLYNGGKKACLEEPFMYFYYNLSDDSKLNTITIEDLYTTETINGVTIINDDKVKFLGFQTWGSAKADDPTYGYDEDTTPEYVLFEGADNASHGANFKQPWAAFQTWNSNLTKKENQETTGSMILQPKSVTEVNYTTGLLIEGETIQFENDTDPWDVDYGIKELDKSKDLWEFTDSVKNNSLPYFVKFYNNCYLYDFTNLIPYQNNEFNLLNSYDMINKRVYMTKKTNLLENGIVTGQAGVLDVYRWDGIKNKWVPAGLHYNNNNWEQFNLKTVYENLKNTDLYNEFKNDINIISESFDANIDLSETDVNTIIIPAFKDMFKANCTKYTDIDDVAYHQAFIKLKSGTDNRAKNTYFQIVGKIYLKNPDTEKFEQTDIGDYKIRLLLDDLDTILATNNNGQQTKPYYLLEPAFNIETEHLWGDEHSSFFYPFDICYEELINQYVGKIIEHLFGNSTSVKETNSNLYDYFFSVQKTFPEIAYNHHAEIYYEMPQVLFYNGSVTKVNGLDVFPITLNEFKNNNVKNPLSLSHGRCLESEYQFIKDRLIMLGTMTATATGLYTINEITLSTSGTGNSNQSTNFKGIATFTDYFYPIKSSKGSEGSEYTKIGNISDKSETPIKYDETFKFILEAPAIPNTIKQLVTPDKEFTLLCNIQTQMGAYLSAGNKYKSLKVINGLDFTNNLLSLPNVEELIIDGINSNYTITESSIVVKNRLPVIEKLELTNVVFNDTILDFRECTRLSVLNLSGCTGISNIIFPETVRLTDVYLPKGITKLTLGKNANLSNLVFDENTLLTSFSLDCSCINEKFDYIEILTKYIDYNNLEELILHNTSEQGLYITEELANKLATVKIISTQSNNKSNVNIKGKYIISERNSEINDLYENVYIWGEKTDISYLTKKILVKAFGNIDSVDNSIYFDYLHSPLIFNSYKISQDIIVNLPSGGSVNPFDELYFTIGNDVGIKNDILNILYNISGSYSTYDINLNKNTGVITVQNTDNINKQFNYSIVVTRSNGTLLSSITGTIYFGYKEPEIGDFAYGDGSFSSFYNPDKKLVGLVYQKEVKTPNEEWILGILSNESITDYAGPAFYEYITQYNTFPNNSEQGLIYHFMTNERGLGLQMTSPTTTPYLGFDSTYQTSSVSQDSINYNYLTDLPTTILSGDLCGSKYTKKLAEVGLDRIKTLFTKNSNLKTFLQQNNYLSDQDEINFDIQNIDVIYNKINDIISSEFGKADYHKILHPLALKTTLYEPNDLTEKGIDYYKKGNWYIPSIEELSLLIWYRIRSTSTSSTALSELNWDSTNYSKGDSIFSNKYEYFGSFLNSTMLASNVSTLNFNFVYDETLYYSNNTYITIYKWFYNYYSDYYYSDLYHHKCRRDFKYTIAPCCTITVKKST